jgi:hypothetical protein
MSCRRKEEHRKKLRSCGTHRNIKIEGESWLSDDPSYVEMSQEEQLLLQPEV